MADAIPAGADSSRRRTTTMSSLKERAGVKRGWPAVFAVAAGLQGMMA